MIVIHTAPTAELICEVSRMYDELKERCRACSQECIYPSECSYFNKPPLRCMRQLLSEAADAIEALSKLALDEHNRAAKLAWERRWIPVTERLPKEMDQSCGGWSAEIRPSDDVLAWLSSEKRRTVVWYSHVYNEWTTVDENTVYCFEEVTHWMPLPEPPKEET